MITINRTQLAVGAIAVLLTVGTVITWALWPRQATDRFDLTGTLELHGKTLHDGHGLCMGQGGYADIAKGTPVTVYNQTGTVIATGELGVGDDHGWKVTDSDNANLCWFTFTVSVPATDFYQVEVASRGRARFNLEDSKAGRVALTLGQ